MAITRATNLANVGSGLGTQPAQPVNIGVGITLDGNSGIITAYRSNFGNVSIDGTGVGIITANLFSGTATNAGSAVNLGLGAQGSTLTLSSDLIVRHINASGIATAAQFSGNITGTAATFTGNVTIGGTLTYDDVTNVDSIGLITARNGLQVIGGITTISGQANLSNTTITGVTTISGQANLSNTTITGVTTISGQANLSNTTITGVTTISNTVIPQESRFSVVAEKMTRVSASASIGVCTYSSDTSNILYFDSPSDNVVVRITGIPTTSAFDNHSITVSAILRTTGTGRSCHTHVQLNGVERPIKFAGGSRNEATSGVTTTNGYTVYNFVGVNTIGSASTTANYEVFGIVSGGFF